MKAAIVVEAGRTPAYGEFREPLPAPGKSVVNVRASSISHVTRGRASGAHYSSAGGFPFVPGIDGTGITADGRRVYFLLPEHPFGAMADSCLVDDSHLIAVPQGLDDDTAAALAIPGASSWAALVERAKLRAGETVLVHGATGASGRLAIQIARHLGAGKVIGTGRNPKALEELRSLGADVTIALTQDTQALETAFKNEFRQGVDVVLDYLWGPSAETLIVAAAKAGPEGVPIRFVQIGSISGANINLPSAALRSSALVMMGSGIGSVALAGMLNSVRGVLEATAAAGLKVAARTEPLAKVAEMWTAGDAETRIVLRP